MSSPYLQYLLFFILFPYGTIGQVLAQSSPVDYVQTAQLIRKALNNGQSQTIYQLTSTSFQQKMSFQQFSTGMNRFKAKNGFWKDLRPQKTNAQGMDFSASFQLSEQLLSLSLDSNGKIQRINFQEVPFVKSNKTFKVKSNNPLKTETDQLVDSLVQPYIQQSHTAGLTLAIIYNGKVSTYSYGTTHKAIANPPDPAQTIFEIGSVTKTFTALLLAKQVTDGQMALTDPISSYLPDSIGPLSFEGEPIRLVNLANHTAGFPRLPDNIFNGNVDPINPYLHYSSDPLFSYLQHYQPKQKAGLQFSYSNYGAGLLGTILERKTGLAFQDLIKRDITHPLNMHATFVQIPDDRKKELATGYNERGMETSPWELASLKGSGAISSTLMDMVSYTQAQLTGRPALAKAIALSHRPTFHSNSQDMALGWRIQQLGKQHYLHHAGGTGGFRSFVGFSKEKQVGIIILSNTAEEVVMIGETLLRRLIQTTKTFSHLPQPW